MSYSCTRWRRAPPTAPTASTWQSSPACRPASRRAPRRCWNILEKGEEGGALARLADDLPLFRAASRIAPAPATPGSPAEDLLREVRPDELTPREALELIYRLKALLAE